MFPKQPYVEVPYVPEEAPSELRKRRLVWYKRPMVIPVLMIVVIAGAAYFAYEMFRGAHPDDGYTVPMAENEGQSPATAPKATATAVTPTIASTSGSGGTDSQITKPTSSIPTVEASTATTPAAPAPATDAPAGDSRPPQPPDGKAYAGTGHLELYRQGNITYQYNTETGDTCVMYASLREWQNPLVVRHSCR